ncbi:MAG TPA: flippase-like domain-containing protein [Anaerolineales bacterium]
MHNGDKRALEEQPKLMTGRVLVGAILLLGLVVGVFVTMDVERMREVLTQADWRAIPAALLFTSISYAATGYLFARISRMMGIEMSTRDLTEIGFTTAALNHVLTSGGVAGYSVRYLLMRDNGVKLKDVLAASALHYYLTSLLMLAALPVAFIYLLLNASMAAGVIFGLSVVTVVVSVIFIIASGLIFVHSMRTVVLDWIARLAKTVTKRDIDDNLENFDLALTRAVKILRRRPREVILAILLVAADEVSSAIVLWFCFTALGPSVLAGEVMAGYVIGIMSGVVSLVPGGLGVQEGSITGVFSLLGTPIEQAVLAAVLFRLIFFFAPYLASFLFFGRLMKKSPGNALS